LVRVGTTQHVADDIAAYRSNVEERDRRETTQMSAPTNPAAWDAAVTAPVAPGASRLVFRARVLVALALVNSIGYAGSTIVPLWVGDIGARLDMPSWFGGAVATAQLLAAAVLNLLTPFLFRKVPPSRLARTALLAAAGFYFLTLVSQPLVFITACVGGGACLGIVLNATNRIIAGSVDVQKGYSIFLLTEGLFGSSMFYSGALLSEHLGLTWVFLTLPAVTLLGAVIMTRLPVAQLDVGRVMTAAPGPLGLRLILGLLALFIFFCGQSCIIASTLTLGRQVGLSAPAASATLAIGVIVGLLGAIASRLLGERFGIRWPILAATAILAAVVFAMTGPGGPMSFYLGVPWIQVTTLFIVPYFFTLLARLDVTGRTASVGPAFLLGGVAVGPSLAAWVTGIWSLSALGPAATIALIASAVLTIAATSRPGAWVAS